MNLNTCVKNWSDPNMKRYLDVFLDRLRKKKTARHKAEFLNLDTLNRNPSIATFGDDNIKIHVS